jgi:Skp family chaperone for outer membrane proteins
MKEVPKSFSCPPGQSLHKYFSNLCIEFRKILEEKGNLEVLQKKMVEIINAAKEMDFLKKRSDVWGKEETDKGMRRLLDEFKRYVRDVESNVERADEKDLLKALEEVERLIKSWEIK